MCNSSPFQLSCIISWSGGSDSNLHLCRHCKRTRATDLRLRSPCHPRPWLRILSPSWQGGVEARRLGSHPPVYLRPPHTQVGGSWQFSKERVTFFQLVMTTLSPGGLLAKQRLVVLARRSRSSSTTPMLAAASSLATSSTRLGPVLILLQKIQSICPSETNPAVGGEWHGPGSG